MKRLGRRIRSEEGRPEINIAPLMDMVFILLIFFIVTTVFVEETGIPVNKPDAAASASNEESENVTVEILENNQIVVDGRKVTLNDVVRRVETAVRDPDTPVMIRAHENSDHSTFVSVWDAARRGGAAVLTFTTVN